MTAKEFFLLAKQSEPDAPDSLRFLNSYEMGCSVAEGILRDSPIFEPIIFSEDEPYGVVKDRPVDEFCNLITKQNRAMRAHLMRFMRPTHNWGTFEIISYYAQTFLQYDLAQGRSVDEIGAKMFWAMLDEIPAGEAIPVRAEFTEVMKSNHRAFMSVSRERPGMYEGSWPYARLSFWKGYSEFFYRFSPIDSLKMFFLKMAAESTAPAPERPFTRTINGSVIEFITKDPVAVRFLNEDSVDSFWSLWDEAVRL